MVESHNRTATIADMARKEHIAEDAWQAFHDVMHLCKDSLLEIAREFDITPGELRALDALDPDSAQSMGSLATELRCDASNITWLADRLEERGLVVRQSDPNDRRVKTLALTPRGRDVRGKITEQLRVPPQVLLTLSAPELRTLHQLLRKCAAAAAETTTTTGN